MCWLVVWFLLYWQQVRMYGSIACLKVFLICHKALFHVLLEQMLYWGQLIWMSCPNVASVGCENRSSGSSDGGVIEKASKIMFRGFIFFLVNHCQNLIKVVVLHQLCLQSTLQRNWGKKTNEQKDLILFIWGGGYFNSFFVATRARVFAVNAFQDAALTKIVLFCCFGEERMSNEICDTKYKLRCDLHHMESSGSFVWCWSKWGKGIPHIYSWSTWKKGITKILWWWAINHVCEK